MCYWTQNIDEYKSFVLCIRFLQNVLVAAEEYEKISRDPSLEPEERARLAAALTVEGATFEQLALTMTHVAPHADLSVAVQPLCDSGENIEVRVHRRVTGTCPRSYKYERGIEVQRNIRSPHQIARRRGTHSRTTRLVMTSNKLVLLWPNFSIGLHRP